MSAPAVGLPNALDQHISTQQHAAYRIETLLRLVHAAMPDGEEDPPVKDAIHHAIELAAGLALQLDVINLPDAADAGP